MIFDITILPGFDKNGCKEQYTYIKLKAGDTVSIVGPTGSGKTALISDIELLAQVIRPQNGEFLLMERCLRMKSGSTLP